MCHASLCVGNLSTNLGILLQCQVLKQKNDILWAHERISKLETALQKATQDLKVREEMSEKWESKTGELQQKIIDLERCAIDITPFYICKDSFLMKKVVLL